MQNTGNKALLIFDDFCVLCSNTVRFLTLIDRRKQLIFTTFGSAVAEKHLKGIDRLPDSLVLVTDDKIYFQSDAIIRIIKLLGFPWNLALAIRIIPRNLREKLYRIIARSRYLIFGKRDSCRIPSADIRNRYLS